MLTNDEYTEHDDEHDEFIPLQVPLSKAAPETVSSYDLCVVFPLIRSNKTHLMEISMDVHNIIHKIIACVGRKYIYMFDSVHGTHRIIVMKDGNIVEAGDAKQIYNNPQNSYTKSLLQSVNWKF